MPSLISTFYRIAIKNSMPFFLRQGDSVLDWQTRMDRFSRRFAQIPRGMTILPVDAGGVPAEWEFPPDAPNDRVLLYIHGGAWITGSPITHRRLLTQVTRAAGIRALSIDYRLAPKYPFPAGLEDCVTAYRWLLERGISAKKIIIMGDSAGGNLALAMLLALRDAGDPLPAAAVCLSPATDLAGTGETMRTRAKVEVLLSGFKNVGNIVDLYAGGHDVHDPLISPLYGDLRGLPPILVHVGDYEILLDDSTRFIERACAAGVDARVVVWPGMWHVFHVLSPAMPEAREAVRQVGEFIRDKMI